MSRLNINKLKKKSKIGAILYNHINNNKREYFIVSILFFIGLIIGVLFINNIKDTKIDEINLYLNNLANNIKNYENIDYISLLNKSITKNIIVIMFLWIGASTIIGVPIVCGIIIVKGFAIGYTISSIITCFGTGKGMLLSMTIMVLHNIIVIPTMFGASVSGLKLYQAIMKNKNSENIKIEFLRHTIFCSLMLILLIISTILEVYGSTNLFILLLKTT